MTTAPDIRLQGAANFRDIGGHITSDGRRIKYGQVFRSGELSHLTDDDLGTLRQIGIAFVADLRSVKEAAKLPSRWPAELATELHKADISADIKIDGRPIMDILREQPTAEGAAIVVSSSFSIVTEMCGAALRVIVERLAEGASPVLFHCTNGRDRTGVIAALLLHVLGATRETIVHDFMLTNERIDVERVITNSIAAYEGYGIYLDRAIVERLMLVRPEYVDAMFDGITTQHGSVDRYLNHHGIDPSLVQRLRDQLLEPA